jgi:hypothetical protein
MNFMKIMMLVYRYGPLVQEAYLIVKNQVENADFDGELLEQVRYWTEAADEVLHFVLRRVYPELMAKSFGVQSPGEKPPAVLEGEAEFLKLLGGE